MSAESKRRAWTRRRDNPDTRQQILDAAALAFAREGYEGASLGAIARSIGITAPSVYNHFKSKNEILFTFLNDHASLVLDRCRAAVDQAGPTYDAQLRAFVRAHVETELAHQSIMPLVNLYFQQGSGAERALTREQQAYFTAAYRRLVDLLRGIIAAGQQSGVFAAENVISASFSILGSASNAIYWFRADGALSRHEVAEQLSDYAVKSLAP